ncbi:uncharacterized protein BJ171DRAFT_454227 [Polychytrium aggregatum]|uniref:uncharacterized protein n=1 Tax=Polychytrium aggregatum TaxID=110093 RepID=UPI0022FE3BA7|nr:uncharacterized protein BJ171DRAFT_454227 [Polychytrium aggregatum]KAI9209251.1 hypothetical protein BJ171DRAFT_454227 [Polychytrium aggregatum]
MASKIISCSNPDSGSLRIPSLFDFIVQMARRSNVQYTTFLGSIVYMRRMREKLPSDCSGRYSAAHRIFLAALLLASKYLCDNSFKNKHWAEFSGMFLLGDVNLMERQMLRLLDYDLHINIDELNNLVDSCAPLVVESPCYIVAEATAHSKIESVCDDLSLPELPPSAPPTIPAPAKALQTETTDQSGSVKPLAECPSKSSTESLAQTLLPGSPCSMQSPSLPRPESAPRTCSGLQNERLTRSVSQYTLHGPESRSDSVPVTPRTLAVQSKFPGTEPYARNHPIDAAAIAADFKPDSATIRLALQPCLSDCSASSSLASTPCMISSTPVPSSATLSKRLSTLVHDVITIDSSLAKNAHMCDTRRMKIH